MIQAKPHTSRKRLSSATLWLILVAGIALLERMLVVLFYQPVSYSDTPSYRRLAEAVLRGFSRYDGTRTPGYPVFLALVGSDQRVWITQLILGLITTLLLFYIGWKLTDKPWFGGVIALAHSLNLGQIFFESNLLTESLTTFLLVLTMAGALTWLLYPKFRTIWLAFLLGVIATATLLVRPLFIYLPFILLLFLWLQTRLERQAAMPIDGEGRTIERLPIIRQWPMLVAFLLPAVLLLGGWVTFVHSQFNQWSLTTMTGYHLVQHTGSFFEYVPDEYALLRDTYIKYRDAHIAEFGTQTNAIWDAIPEMSRVSGYSFYGLSRVLTSISLKLIEQHPVLFIKSALSGWWMFWRAPVYWSPDAVKLPSVTPLISFAIQVQRVVVILINFVFILASLYFMIIEAVSALRHRSSFLDFNLTHPISYHFMWLILANIWIASILQTLLDHGDNPRFLVPLQSQVVLWVGVFIFFIVSSRRTGHATSSPA